MYTSSFFLNLSVVVQLPSLLELLLTALAEGVKHLPLNVYVRSLFDDVDADYLPSHSSDHVDFTLYKIILTKASSVFRIRNVLDSL